MAKPKPQAIPKQHEYSLDPCPLLTSDPAPCSPENPLRDFQGVTANSFHTLPLLNLKGLLQLHLQEGITWPKLQTGSISINNNDTVTS